MAGCWLITLLIVLLFTFWFGFSLLDAFGCGVFVICGDWCTCYLWVCLCLICFWLLACFVDVVLLCV